MNKEFVLLINEVSKRNALKYLLGTCEGAQRADVFDSICSVSVASAFDILDSIFDDCSDLFRAAEKEFLSKLDKYYKEHETNKMSVKHFTRIFVLALSANKTDLAKDLLIQRERIMIDSKKRKNLFKHTYANNDEYVLIFDKNSFINLSQKGFNNYFQLCFEMNRMGCILQSFDNLDTYFYGISNVVKELAYNKALLSKLNKTSLKSFSTIFLKYGSIEDISAFALPLIRNDSANIGIDNIDRFLNDYLDYVENTDEFLNTYMNNDNKVLFYQYALMHRHSNVYKALINQINDEINRFIKSYLNLFDYLIKENLVKNLDYSQKIDAKPSAYINPDKDSLPGNIKISISKLVWIYGRYGVNFYHYRSIPSATIVLKIYENKHIPTKIMNQVGRFLEDNPTGLTERSNLVKELNDLKDVLIDDLRNVVVQLRKKEYIMFLGDIGKIDFSTFNKFFFINNRGNSEVARKLNPILQEANVTLSKKIGYYTDVETINKRLFYIKKLRSSVSKLLELIKMM